MKTGGGVSFNARENREKMTAIVTKKKYFSDFFHFFFFLKNQKTRKYFISDVVSLV